MKPVAFVLAVSSQSTMIVNRFDFNPTESGAGYGVGGQILQTGSYQPDEVNFALELLKLRRKKHGDGVVAIDCGANIGAHTIAWAKLMTDWGSVVSIEAQEKIYYALAGNIVLNNCMNVRAIHAAVSHRDGMMGVPELDYTVPTSFGSLELHQSKLNEEIGQPVDYSKLQPVRMLSLDTEFENSRVDFIKLDIQRMELEALEGATNLLKRERPIMLIEKTDVGTMPITKYLEPFGYIVKEVDAENVLAMHVSDTCLTDLLWRESDGLA